MPHLLTFADPNRFASRPPSPNGAQHAPRSGGVARTAATQVLCDGLAQATAPGPLLSNPALVLTQPSQPALPQELLATTHDRCMRTLGAAQAAIGAKGEARTFEELRRAIVSAQGPNGHERLHLGGCLARWFGLGCKGATPRVWQLLVELPTATPADEASGRELESAAQRIAKRLAKRGFIGARAEGHDVLVDAAQPLRSVRLRVCGQGALCLPEALACEQLTYEMGSRTWRPLPHSGLTLAQAQRFMEAGFWRVPADPKPSLSDVDEGAAPGARALQHVLSQFAHAWRHLQQGYSPQDLFDVADTALVVAALAHLDKVMKLPPKDIKRTVVALIHETLAPALSAEGSEARLQQLGLAAVALGQVQSLVRLLPEAAKLQILATAIDGFIQSQGLCVQGPAAQALTLARALSGPNERTVVLRLLLSASPDTDHLSTQNVEGMRETMLRVALPDCRTHLFVPHPAHEVVAEQAGSIDLAGCMRRATSFEHLLGLCLDCPQIPALTGLAQADQNETYVAWAKALVRAARMQPNNSGLLIAVALLHADTFAQLPAAWQASCLPWPTLIDALEAAAHHSDPAAWAAQLMAVVRLRLQHKDQALRPALQDARLLLAPLMALGADDAALAVARPEVLQSLNVTERLRLLGAGLHRTDGWAHALVTSLRHSIKAPLADADAVRVLVAACAQPHLLLPMAELLAHAPLLEGKVWQAFMGAASTGAEAAALSSFVSEAPGDHPHFYAALCTLGDGHGRDYDERRCKNAALGWSKWLQEAHAPKPAKRIEAKAAILRLHLMSTAHSHEALCHEPKLASLAMDIIDGGGTGDARQIALSILALLVDEPLRATTFVWAVGCLEAQDLLNSGLDIWLTGFADNLTAIAPHLPPLSHLDADRLQKLALAMGQTRGHGANTRFSNTAVIAQVMLQHGFTEGACLILARALLHSHAQHVMFATLTRHPILSPDHPSWLKLVELASTMLAHGRHTHVHRSDSAYTSQVRFFQRVAESAVQARCATQVLQMRTHDQVQAALQEATRLLVAMAQFCTLTEHSPCIKSYRRAIAATGTHDGMLEHTVALAQNLMAGNRTELGDFATLPPSILTAALPKPDAAEKEPAARARRTLRALFGDEINAATGVPEAHASAAAHAYAIAMSAWLLQGWEDEEQMVQILRGLVTSRLHDDQTVAHLDGLAHRLPENVSHGPNHPLLLAARHLIDARGEDAPNALAEEALEAACFNVCFALRVLTAEVDEPQRMDAIVGIVQSIKTLPASSRAYWHAATSGSSFMDGLNSSQKAAIDAFHARFALENTETIKAPSPLWNADRNLRAHLEALLERLQGPRDRQRHVAVLTLLALGQNYVDYAEWPAFKDFQRGLSRILTDRDFYLDVIDMLVAYTMDPSRPIINLPFIHWLNGAFLQAAPMTATYIGWLLTMLELHPKEGSSKVGVELIINDIKGFTVRGIEPASRLTSTLFLRYRQLVAKEKEPEIAVTLMEKYHDDILSQLIGRLPQQWPPPPEAILGPYAFVQ